VIKEFDAIFSFFLLSGTLALIPERRSARKSKN